MARPILTAREAAGYLDALDNVLLLTHVRPDGDTIGSAAALCRALRDCGRTAYLLPNPEITATYAAYAAGPRRGGRRSISSVWTSPM